MGIKQVKQIVNSYAETLRFNKMPFKHIYLFGSFASGHPQEASDIDVLVVTDKFRGGYGVYKKDLWNLTRSVDTRIEPHTCTTADFVESACLVASEARRSGLKIV